MENIQELKDSKIIANILNNAFLKFAQEHNFTKENAPNHLAYITFDKIDVWLNTGLKMYGYRINDKIVGCGGYSHLKNQIYFIQRLAVLSEYQNLGVGKKIMEFLENEIVKFDGKIIEIHVTDINTALIEWYKKQGYIEKRIDEVKIPGIKKIPFKACVMNKEL